MLQNALHATLLCWTPYTAVVPSSRWARCQQPSAVSEADFDLSDFGASELPELPDWVPRTSSKGARAKRNEVADYAKSLGAEKGYANVDDFVQEHVPASGQPGQRRRKKQWDPSKRKPHKKERPRSDAPPAAAPEALLAASRVAFADACSQMVEEIEFVGAVLSRVPKGENAGAYKVWVDREVGMDADLLADVSRRLRDALRDVVPGRPAISVFTPGRTRPLFTLGCFDRFRGLRAQVTLRESVDGRKRLKGELLGIEETAGGPYVLVEDESAQGCVRVPFAALQLGEKTALQPLHADSGPLAYAKPRRGGKTAGSEEACIAIAEELRVAPVTVFLKSYCPYCRRALKVLRDSIGLEPGDDDLHVVALENREDMVALQQQLKQRTGAGTVPRVFFGASGWVGGAEELEALAASGPGPLAARLMEARSEHEREMRLDELMKDQL